MSRNPRKDMYKSHGAFETQLRLAEHALTSAKTKAKKLGEMKDKLEAAYLKYDEDYRMYRADVIEKECKTMEAFNSNSSDDPSEPVFPQNDEWSHRMMLLYIDATEKVEEKIETLETAEKEAKPDVGGEVEDNATLIAEVESEKTSIKKSIDTFSTEVDSLEEINLTKAAALERFSEKIKERVVAVRFKVRRFSTIERNNSHDFLDLESVRIDSILLQICSKIPEQKEFKEHATTAPPPRATDAEHDRVHLEKSKPPKFKGDITEYPEFKRRWKNIVGKARLPPEAEIERLKECVPAEAKDQLYAIEEMAKAWDILDKRYGDANLIAKKLKIQLKTIQSEGKSDPENLISLNVKVRAIVVKLESLGMSEALKHDSEFLSAVYCALPDKHKTRWLDFEKSKNHWEDMLKFLERAYNQANEELALLGTYEADIQKQIGKAGKSSSTKTFAVVVKKDENGEDSDAGKEDSAKEKARKRSQEFCGVCPACNKDHTWVRKAGDKWPSDRFLSCKRFNDMTVAARASQVQKSNGCPRCLSWNHARAACKMPANSCNKDLAGGAKCKGDHSKLLCGSGNPYCAAVSAQQHRVSPLGKDVDGGDFANVDESADTVYFLQDIPVQGSHKTARTFWDRGSNRVFVRKQFAEAMKLKKKKVRFSMETVSHDTENLDGYIYLLNLVDIYGKPHRVWGYSIDKIMVSTVPDLSSLQSQFPHVPGTAFDPMETREVDILMGLNMSDIMPAGGLGVDRVGGMVALRSIFGAGWVVGGVLDSQTVDGYATPSISSQAVTARCAKVLVMPEPGLTPDFWEYDQLGVKLPARCDRCRHCLQTGECSDAHAKHTMKEKAELELIKANTRLENGQIWCDYPYIKDPACLPNNRAAAVAVAEKVRQGLKKDNLLHAYNEQVQQILDRGAAVKISKQELDEYVGPSQYISHHAVLKDSVSTPCRMVTNSSFNNSGNSLNSCLAAGPNSLNPMLDVTLRFRCRECALQYDLSKAYNSMKTSIKERHLRRFVWKFREEEDWEDFGFDCVHCFVLKYS